KKQKNGWIVLLIGICALLTIYQKTRDKRGQVVARRAEHVFDILDRVLPRRVATEEIGDALECIECLRLCHGARFVWTRIYWAVFTTSIVAIVNSLRYLASSPWRTKADE
ncbi:MAG TPA: hypothetical protein VK989_15085, partial [Polyangia bacterium]|nr:hypothetical protein [Polyangia bacterium]